MLLLLICEAISSVIHVCPDSAGGPFFGLHCCTVGAIENKPYGYAPAPVQSYTHAPGYYAAPAVDSGVGMGGHE
ncbi:hypothetical protein PQR41_13550 [Paraburkholderia xenovorans]